MKDRAGGLTKAVLLVATFAVLVASGCGERTAGSDKQLASKDPSVRRGGALALASSRDPKRAGRLAKLLATDPDQAVRAASASALARVHADGDSDWSGSGAVDALIDALSDESARVAEAAALSLKEIGAAAALPALLATARNHRDPLVRHACVGAVAELGDASAVDGLIEIWRSNREADTTHDYDDLVVHLSVQQAIVELGDATIPTLVEALKDERWWVRRRAVATLVELHAYEALTVIDELAQSDPRDIVRAEARRAIGVLSAKRRRPPDSPDPTQ